MPRKDSHAHAAPIRGRTLLKTDDDDDDGRTDEAKAFKQLVKPNPQFRSVASAAWSGTFRIVLRQQHNTTDYNTAGQRRCVMIDDTGRSQINGSEEGKCSPARRKKISES